MMGGLDWSALPMVCDLIGINDPEPVVLQLVMIRDHNRTAWEIMTCP